MTSMGKRVKRRRVVAAFLGFALAAPFLSRAQQASVKTPKVGVLWPGSPPDKWDSAFRRGMQSLGYVDGKTIRLEYRWAQGKQENLSKLASELVQAKVDLIVT